MIEVREQRRSTRDILEVVMLAAHFEDILRIDPIGRKDRSQMMYVARSIPAWRIK